MNYYFNEKQNRCRVQQDISGALSIIKKADKSFWPGFAEGQVLLEEIRTEMTYAVCCSSGAGNEHALAVAW